MATHLPTTLVAVLGSQFTSVVVQIVLLPRVLELLGADQFGLLAFLATLQGIVRLADLGYSMAITRRLAATRGDFDLIEYLSSFEAAYLVMGLAIAAVIGLSTGLIATRWLTASDSLPAGRVETALVLMGIVCSLFFVNFYYAATLNGRSLFVTASMVRLVETLLTLVGGYVAIRTIEPSIECYLAVQAAAGLAVVLLAKFAIARDTGYAVPTRISMAPFRALASFASGIFVISLATFLLTGFDRIVLSHTLSLAEFGFYGLACTVHMGLAAILVAPTFNIFFPRISEAVHAGASDRVSSLFHVYSQLMSAVAVPACLTLSVFAPSIVSLWLWRDETAAAAVAAIVRIAILGTGVNALLNSSYALQLAMGKTRVPLLCNLAASAVALPLYFVLIPLFGGEGAAMVWTISMLTYLVVSTWLTAPLVPNQIVVWVVEDTLIPGAAALVVIAGIALIPIGQAAGLAGLVKPAVAGLLAVAAATMVAPRLRKGFWRMSLSSANSAGVPLESHSQFAEDAAIFQFFDRKPHGTFVDVGANDGVTGSNSLLLEKAGWRGVLVEPNQSLAEQCRIARPDAVVLAKAAVGPGSPDNVVFFEYSGTGPRGENFDAISSVGARSFLDELAHRGGGGVREVVVPAATLTDLLLEAGFAGTIDFLSVDVEGLELDVLAGFDLARFQPRLILVEDNSFGEDRRVVDLLESAGYRRVHRTGVNDWFVPAALADRFRTETLTLSARLVFWRCARALRRLIGRPLRH